MVRLTIASGTPASMEKLCQHLDLHILVIAAHVLYCREKQPGAKSENMQAFSY